MTIDITFNKDGMTARDLKACTNALEGILDQFDIQLQGGDWSPEQAEEFCIRVLQIRDRYTTERQRNN